ncbi:MAG: 16S rRNA (cytidine(1402)-2'-O)-methyltransferase [Clostridia bacterium]|nr:16S rRNA (cytidine(1402)-2'-O)-methyltransferase [Clostridia bacterium]
MLYVVATPIGNLEDISARALRILSEVELIAAEDTRHTLGLLTHFGIKKPLVSYYEHNKLSRGPELLTKLEAGADIALVSDAGLPGICDPGYELIKSCVDAGIEVTVVPGPCACVTALVLSGLPTDGFVFEGFIGTDNKRRRAFFERLRKEPRTTVCYEAPHRILKTLAELEKLFADAGEPDRRVAILRELTKTHEEALRGTATELIARFETEPPRGEFVLCIAGADDTAGTAPGGPADEAVARAFYEELIARGAAPKAALKDTMEKYGLTRNDAYRIVKVTGGHS